MTNKLIICILTLLLLYGCSSSKASENGTVNATTRIAYSVSEDKIKVSNVIIKCNDNYYGVSVNDSINYNSNNNYFTTGSGLTVMITSEKLKTGSTTKDDIYTAASKIEDNVYLYVSGNDKDKVNEIFNNVFKTNKLSYTFLAHDIDDDWTKEVNITEDVISFSNGTDVIYAYQNPGSLSDGCINGRIEPTVFKKALRGIDIPITYPEDTNDEWDYTPYGIKEYEHWTNEGYTPYSAYQATEYGTEMVKTIEVTTEITKDEMTNYILLAKNDQAILSLFNDKNDHTQTLYSLSIPSGNTETLDLSSNINLSNMKDLASSVINSENRYHFGVLKSSDNDGYIKYNFNGHTGDKLDEYTVEQTGYYVDGYPIYYEKNLDRPEGYSIYSSLNSTKEFTIANAMNGKLVIPTIKISMPIYSFGGVMYLVENVISGSGRAPYESLSTKGILYAGDDEYMSANYLYAMTAYSTYGKMGNSSSPYWCLHAYGETFDSFLKSEPSNFYASSGNSFEYVQEGDYAYEIIGGYLNIYAFENTKTYYDEEFLASSNNKGLVTSISTYEDSPVEETNKELLSCYITGNNNLEQNAKLVGRYMSWGK